MHQSVRDRWPAMCSKYEGRCWWMYLDTKRLVTTGLGILLETVEEAQSFPWFRISDGQPATKDEIASEYRRVKNLTELAKRGGFAYKPGARLRLPEHIIDEQLLETTGRFWAGLTKAHPAIEEWPADAQLAALDLSWQNGPAFTKAGGAWPTMRAAFNSQDWKRAASAVPGTHPRAKERKRLFLSAAKGHPEAPKPIETPDPTPLPVGVIPGPGEDDTTTLPGDDIANLIAGLPVKKHPKYGEYVTLGGEHFAKLDLEIVLRCCAAVGWGTVHHIQGGLSKGSLSANTHARLAGGDLRTRDKKLALVWLLAAALIRSGVVAFVRGVGKDSFDPHIHWASNESIDRADPSLQRQIAEYLRGGDGLVGSKPFNGPSIKLGTWEQSPYNPANITEDTGTYFVNTTTDPLLGNDVDRRIIESRARGVEVKAVQRVQRWGRTNVVTAEGVYFALEFLSTEKPAEPVNEGEPV